MKEKVLSSPSIFTAGVPLSKTSQRAAVFLLCREGDLSHWTAGICNKMPISAEWLEAVTGWDNHHYCFLAQWRSTIKLSQVLIISFFSDGLSSIDSPIKGAAPRLKEPRTDILIIFNNWTDIKSFFFINYESCKMLKLKSLRFKPEVLGNEESR